MVIVMVIIMVVVVIVVIVIHVVGRRSLTPSSSATLVAVAIAHNFAVAIALIVGSDFVDLSTLKDMITKWVIVLATWTEGFISFVE